MDITYEKIKDIVNGKLVDRTLKTPFEDLSEQLFGEGITFSDVEVRKRMYGMKRLIEVIESESESEKVHTRILSVSDTHIPFQHPVTVFEKYQNKVDILQINGDVSDFQALSRFSKTYRVSPMEELIEARQYLIDLINYVKPKKVVINYGNHDIRFQAYLAKNLDSDILELMPKTSLELIVVDGFNHYNKREGAKTYYKPLTEVFDSVEIDYVDSWYSQIGETIFCHPSAFSSGILKTAEKAMYWFRNEGFDFRSLVMAHTHRIGYYVIGNTAIYEGGCCCDTKKNHYTGGQLVNSHKEGYLYICQDKDGKVIKNKTKLEELN